MTNPFRGGVATRGTALYVNSGYSFTPDAASLRDPVESTADAWAVEVQPAGCSTPWSWRAVRAGRSRRADEWLGQNERMDRCGTERMMPTAEWHNLDHQTAAFRRDAWMLVASAARIPAEVGPTGILRSALALGEPATLDLTTTAAAIDADRVFRASAVIDTAGYVASIEVVGPDAVARARFGVRPQPLADGFGLSDLALVDPRFESAALAIEDALLPSLVLPRDANVGLYFEVYGIENGESLDLTLTTEKTGAGLVTRIGRFFGLAADERAVEVAWSDPGSENARIARRFLNLDLAALDDGEQRITLTVNTADGREARVTRVVTLRSGPPRSLPNLHIPMGYVSRAGVWGGFLALRQGACNELSYTDSAPAAPAAISWWSFSKRAGARINRVAKNLQAGPRNGRGTTLSRDMLQRSSVPSASARSSPVTRILTARYLRSAV